MIEHPTTIQEARETGHAAAESCADHAGAAWKNAAYDALCSFARFNGQTFTIEDVRYGSHVSAPPDGRAWGQVAMRAKRNGVIQACGFSPTRSSNGSPKVLWRSSLVTGGRQTEMHL